MRRLFTLVLLAILTACGTPKPFPAPMASPLLSSTPNLPTPDKGLCAPTRPRELPSPASFAEYPQAVSNYLNSGSGPLAGLHRDGRCLPARRGDYRSGLSCNT